MAVREFVDDKGTEWRAWEITPDTISPPTRGEDYLADCYQLGWVVMETTRGDRRVRLCPIPRDWQRLSDAALSELLHHGEGLPARTASGREPIANMAIVRSFRYPGGRVWTASVTVDPAKRGARVLRFSAGARSIDVLEWPTDWADLPDDRLIAILRRAAPRGTLAATPEEQRRWDDRRA